MYLTLKEIILEWEKTYGEDLCEKYPGFIRNLIIEFDKLRSKTNEGE